MKLQVELFYDGEVEQWGYTVPALSIVGTGCDSREEAQRLAVEAIEFALEAGDEELSDEADVMTLDIRVARTG